MENISLSLPRRSFSSNAAFTSHKSVYDDVFGGPPKLGLPTLAPRFEDYSEIFGGFHTSQSSSIPVLHLPLLTSDDPDIHFDIDYTEVFGGCGGFNITPSPEDLVAHSSGGYYSDSPDDPWSPAQSGSLLDELDPMVGSDKSHSLSDGDSQQSLASINQQNASYNKSCHMSAETVLTSITHVTNFSAVPGYTFSLYENPVSWDGEDEPCSMGARVTKEKQYEFSSNPVQSGLDLHRGTSKRVEKHGNSTSVGDKPFVTVSDISLRTKPSRLPPPSRPPPALVDKRRECDKKNSEILPSSDRVADDIAPLFIDMEIDGTMFVEGRGSVDKKNVKANNQGAKEPTERKYFHSLSAAQVEEKTDETIRVDTDIDYENFLQSCGGKNAVLLPVVEERTESTKYSQEISGPLGADCCNSNADNLAEAVAWRESTGYFEMQTEAKRDENKVEVRPRQKDSPKRTNSRFVDSQKLKETSGKHEDKILMEEFHRRFEDVEGAEMREIVQERMIAEGTEMQHSGYRPEGAYELKENDVILTDAKKHTEIGEKSSISALIACKKDMNMEAGKIMMNELASGKALEQALNDKYHKLIHEVDVLKKRNQDVSKNDNEFLRFRTETKAGNVEEAFETTGNIHSNSVTCSPEELNENSEETDSIGRNEHDGSEVEWELDDIVFTDEDQLKILERGCEINEVTATKVSGKHDSIQMQESNRRAFSSAGDGDLRNKPKSSTYESETGIHDTLVTGRLYEFSKNKDESLDKSSQSATNNSVMSPSVSKQMSDPQVCGSGFGVSCVMSGKMSSALERSQGEGYKMNNARFVERVNTSNDCDRQQMTTEPIVSGGKIEDVSSCLKHNDAGLYSKKDATSLPTERKDSNMKGNILGEDQKVGGRIRRETVPENEHMRKIEEEREREREREKDRMAVDKAALEAREISYFEARERSERAAVERATAEVRKRAITEAQERLEKASMEARLRSDRAAVERATAEARQRAAEKLMAQKTAHDPLDHIERLPDRFSDSAGSIHTRQRFLSSDINFQGSGVSSRLRYPYSSAHTGAESESPQRCKARLERYRRTAERAANALAEKNRRDHLAQREREERNVRNLYPLESLFLLSDFANYLQKVFLQRVAESLDTEVKRWSSGKEGNLRALLSTLQYILGPDSGWHPLSLTEVITSAAVKRAYRRATLCVHPDKLQQRGATIQQKYICEKVFDLLKVKGLCSFRGFVS